MTLHTPDRTAIHRGGRALVLLTVLALATGLLPGTAQAQDGEGNLTIIGDDTDPVQAAIDINQAPVGDPTSHAVLGRADVFADNLAATALTGTGWPLLLTDGGPDASLREEVRGELDRTLVDGDCTDPATGPTVLLAGGVQAVSAAVQATLEGDGFCVQRLEGPSRVETAVAVADAVPNPSDTVVLARADDWADAGSVGAWAADTGSPVLITYTDSLHPATRAALDRLQPAEVILIGGVDALSDAVEEEVATIADVRRVAGPARDGTAVAIAEELWARDGGAVALADGYGDLAWTYLFAAAGYAADRDLPILYALDGERAPATVAHLDQVPATSTTAIGPGVLDGTPPVADLDAARVALTEVASVDAPLMLKALPNSDELWVAERAGRIQAIGPDGTRQVLDISGTVSADGERGLLGLAFDPEGERLFTSSTDNAGDSVIDRFDVVDGVVDPDSRRELLQVDQPASNHNGGDLHWGPDGYLWWSLGDGGGGGDTYENGQNPGTLLGSLVRIDVDGGDPYAIPPGNPFADGQGGAPELWAYGLRNPFRFAFDAETGDLYIADVGQSAREEIDVVPTGLGAGSNFGWPIFEGTQPFRGGDLPGHVPPVWEETHDAGNCSITGGVVYRGSAIPELYGAYLYSDLCNSSIRAILVEDGQVVQDADLGVSVASPVGFGVDHDGEVLVMSLNGPVTRLVSAG